VGGATLFRKLPEAAQCGPRRWTSCVDHHRRRIGAAKRRRTNPRLPRTRTTLPT